MNGTLRRTAKWVLRPGYRRECRELARLSRMPRFVPTTTDILGPTLQVPDGPSFDFIYREVFRQEIYRFRPAGDAPRIIDGGANIGLSAIYFKMKHPKARVIAFEPDPAIFAALEQNVRALGFGDVELERKALWRESGELSFMSDGADGGRAVSLIDGRRTTTVPAVRLRDYLAEPVDFLKLDVEGAETEILRDCADALGNVRNLFVEYHSFIGQRQTLDEVSAIILDAGFRLHVHPPVTAPQPFYERPVNMGMDMQLNLFAFREGGAA